ncbi:hypothetical protein AB4851_06940 [Burkholderia sp. 22PA0099]|uniref:hypothetical protein n=1 Tax=Burkholderia sp. 22PA0099 TaxID=3237372 RepID=UPI0039C12FF1
MIRLAAGWLAAAAASAGFAQASADPSRPVDLFPAQRWASLGAEEAGAAPPVEAPPDLADPIDVASAPQQQVMPFSVAGEWRAPGQRIVVLEGGGKTFLLCGHGCGVPDAVLPGGEIADGYLLKALDDTGPVVMIRDGVKVELAPASPTP